MYKSQYESVPFGYSYRGTFNEGASEKPVVVLARQKSFSSIYIYQRIGMIIFSRINEGEFIKDYPYLYIVLCVMITLLMGYMYKYIKIKI